MEQQIENKPESNILLIVSLSVIITTLIVGTSVYFWQNQVLESTSADLQSKIKNLNNKLAEANLNIISPDIQDDIAQNLETPQNLCQKEDLGQNYVREGDNIYYQKLQNGANDGNFQTLSNGYAKNNSWVFFKDDIIRGSNPDSFTVLNDIYAKDKFNVYQLYFDEFHYERVKWIEADPGSFVVVDDQYAKDRNKIFGVSGSITPDPMTFEKINDWFYKDKNYVYQENDGMMPPGEYQTFSIVEGADPNTFEPPY